MAGHVTQTVDSKIWENSPSVNIFEEIETLTWKLAWGQHVKRCVKEIEVYGLQ